MDRINKPWGYEEILVNNGKYVIKKIFVKGGHRLSLQAHEVKLETQMICKGKGTITLGDMELRYDVRIGTPTGMPKLIDISIPNTIHRIEAIEDTIIYEVSTLELNDVVRLEDDYGRA